MNIKPELTEEDVKKILKKFRRKKYEKDTMFTISLDYAVDVV
jgi:hypothetical protein